MVLHHVLYFRKCKYCNCAHGLLLQVRLLHSHTMPVHNARMLSTFPLCVRT